MKLVGSRSEEESASEHRAEEDGEVEWLKKRLGDRAKLESSRNEVEVLRRLNFVKGESVSSVSLVGTPP